MLRKLILLLIFLTLGFGQSLAFERMIKTYAKEKIEYPHLKAVTLAMMILESGRGNSDLARTHKNYAGLKYRNEMRRYANKVHYKASDGYDYYCEFKDDKSFIKGFWAFLDRKPYEGWRKSSHSPISFLRKIASTYCPYNKNYVSQVMSLIPEAKRLLLKYEKVDSRLVFLD